MDDFKIDARRWRFLDNPSRYIKLESRESGGLKVDPLTRQFNTAKEILARLADGRGVLLADDVGLGKTTVGALVAWVVACQGKRVHIYAPNKVLRDRWAEELGRHVPMLKQIGASSDRIKQGKIKKLNAGRIQVTTHHALVKNHKNIKNHINKGQQTACDLMIIDEAHRAKGDGSAFKEALSSLGNRAKRKLILTATPFSIQLTELEQLLTFVGATEFNAISNYANELKRLHTLGDGHEVAVVSKRLVNAAKAAIDQLQPYLIRHGINDLSAAEQKHFGAVGATRWDITTPAASPEDLQLLLRMDRLLQLSPERKGARRNDPRFHIGWQYVGTELERVAERSIDQGGYTALRHIEEAKKALAARSTTAHPKIAAVSEAIRPILNMGEKVLVFCHHRATAAELLTELERTLKAESVTRSGPPEEVWRAAWEFVLTDITNEPRLEPIIDWLCSLGIRSQISGWLGETATNAKALAEQLSAERPRQAPASVPTIALAARNLAGILLDTQSKSTRALLLSIAKGSHAFGGKSSHFPGRLDEGIRVMGSWGHDGHGERPKTLYTGKVDIVLALFNSPFGPDVLVTTDRLSEGVDMHRCCRHLIHYELDPSPVRTLQRNGRVRRVGSWAAMTEQAICYAYPTFGGTRDEKAVSVMRQRINVFGLLLGGVPQLDDNIDNIDESKLNFAEAVLLKARKNLESLNRKLAIQHQKH